MKKKILKAVYWIVGIVIVILAFLSFLGFYGQKIQNYFILKQQEKMLAEGQKRAAEILELQKNDTYGGKTPEETLDLYIKALKVGDIELASKYSEISIENVDLQKNELESFKSEIQRDGDLHVVLENMDNIKENGVKNVWSKTEVSFVYYFVTKGQSTSTTIISRQEIETVYPRGFEEHIGISLKLNPYTNVWKII
jgi:hypothetical protein